MKSKYQEEKINIRILKTVEEFLNCKGNISDIELAQKLNSLNIETSSSTVGRDLNSKQALYLLGEEKYKKIEELRKRNRHNAKIKGGQNYALNNISIKDEDGKFNGSKKR